MQFALPSPRVLLYLLLASSTFVACNDDETMTTDDDDQPVAPVTPPNPANPDLPYSTGLSGVGDLSKTPVNASFGFGNATLPSAVDLTPHLPPVGNQGNYGTCVAWAVGYNLKSSMNAIDANETGQTLASPSKQGSPSFLYTAVPDREKSANCAGMQFEPAFEVMRTKGLATLADVPYSKLGDCTNQFYNTAWEAGAANNKIQGFRRIEGTVTSIKKTLNDKLPIAFGAELGEAFMKWRGDGVINANGNIDPNAQHGRHAMVIIGYDDAKGASGAFRVVNSWDVSWGDRGFIWIDYNFLVNEMAIRDQNGNKALFVASQEKGTDPNPNPTIPNPNPNPNPTTEGADLLSWVYEDNYDPNSQSRSDRVVSYDIYNFGTGTARAAQNWDVYYVYYNAYNMNDYGVLFQNQLSTSGNPNGPTCGNGGCVVNADVAPNSSLGTALFGSETIVQGYSVPNITGDYFLVMIADGEEEIAEQDEQDNYYFPSYLPLRFNNGVYGLQGGGEAPTGLSAKLSSGADVRARHAAGRLDAPRPIGNAYTVSELKGYIRGELANGNIARKAAAAQASALRTSDSQKSSTH